MDKKTFISFCKTYFVSSGFQKKGNTFYMLGRDLLCGIVLQKSNFGDSYYINYCFWLEGAFDNLSYPPRHNCDIEGRFRVMSKSMTHQGKPFATPQIKYEDYSEEELRMFFDNEYQNLISPPIKEGKRYIADNLNKLYYLTLNQEEVLRKLSQ